jgi:hypothetical protein
MGFIGKTCQVKNKWRRSEGYGYEMQMDTQKWGLVCLLPWKVCLSSTNCNLVLWLKILKYVHIVCSHNFIVE